MATSTGIAMGLASHHAWTGHALSESLLRFNFSPSSLLHPTRWADLMPEAARRIFSRPLSPSQARVLHRHWSGHILSSMGLAPVVSLQDASLPLCMAAPELFERLTLCCGLVVLGPQVRRVIVRREVAQLAEQLGAFGLNFARDVAARLWDGEATEPVLEAGCCKAQALRLGAGLLSLSLSQAGAAVQPRAVLRLPADAGEASQALPAALADARLALSLARSTLHELDPAWCSLFRDPR